MGYAGYFSTTARLKDKPTELQAALAAVPGAESLQILEKLLYNLAVMPKEQKYRRIKLSNPKIKATIADVPEAKQVLSILSWEEIEEEGEVFLALPQNKGVTMAQVRDIQAAQQEFTRKQRDLKRSASAASLPGCSEQQRLRAQIEADRQERLVGQTAPTQA